MTDADTPDRGEQTAAVYRLAKLTPPTLRRSDVADQAGIDTDQASRWWRALGFAEVGDDEQAFREADVNVVRELGRLVDAEVLDDDDVLRMARLMSTTFSRLVDAQLDLLDQVLATVAPDLPYDDRLRGAANVDFDVVSFLEESMTYVWRRHLLGAIGNRLTVDRVDTEKAVVFADLSGFSRLSRTASSDELTRVIDTFEADAFDVVSTHAGRVVKLIGDEVMFVVDDFDVAVDAALDLVTRLADAPGMPPVHCGIAYGPTITVGGDVFGLTVNLASRLTSIARPGSIAVDRSGAEHLLDRHDIDVRKVRRSYDFKGIGKTHILAIRPAGTDDR